MKVLARNLAPSTVRVGYPSRASCSFTKVRIDAINLPQVRKNSSRLERVEIARVEIADIAQRLPVREADGPPFAINQALGLKALQPPVDVNRREARRVGKLLLGHRQLIVA